MHYFPVTADDYFTDSLTGCADVCLALGRLGEDGSCMPNDPECINWQTQENWPKKGNGQSRTMSVGTYCLCGPLDRSKLAAQSARIVQGDVRPADTTTTTLNDVRGFDSSGRRLWDGVNSTYVAMMDAARFVKHNARKLQATTTTTDATSTLNVETDIISTGTDTSTWTWDQPSISAGIDRCACVCAVAVPSRDPPPTKSLVLSAVTTGVI